MNKLAGEFMVDEAIAISSTNNAISAAKMGVAIVSPDIQAALTTYAFADAGVKRPDLAVLSQQLHFQCEAVNVGDLRHVETMLTAQAATLDVIFGALARRAADSLAGGNLATAESLMRMAFRAQAQCRATLEAVVEAKSPPIVFARQANVTSGPQQINNGLLALSPAEKSEVAQFQLSGGKNELHQDSGTPGTASSGNKAMATLETIYRAEVAGR
jgi:hypothetical protein